MNSNYRIVKDEVYGYLRVDPVPSQEEVDRYYKEEFYSSTYKAFNDSSLNVQQDEQDFFNSRWDSIYDMCISYFGDRAELSLFDIGFGFAQALIYFRDKGFKVCGLEPSSEGVEYAKSQGLNVYQAGIEDFSCVGSQRYDVVTILNVLEHLRKPAETLLNIREQLLKPGGLLVIDVPNEFNDFQVVANEEYNLNQWWLCPPNHINYFSGSSLKKLLTLCGYEVKCSEASFPLEMFLLMGEVYVGDADLGKKCHKKRVRFENLLRKYGKQDVLKNFYKSLADLNLGRQIVVYSTSKK